VSVAQNLKIGVETVAENNVSAFDEDVTHESVHLLVRDDFDEGNDILNKSLPFK
jgi:hypothetical protein